VRGPIALSFWNGARDLLRTIEEELAYVCLLEIGFPEEPLRQMLAKHGAPHAAQGPPSGLSLFALEGRADPDVYRAVWGPWIGRESAVYAACWKIVAALSWTDVVARCGPKVRAHMQVVAAEHRRLLSTDLPRRLRLGVLSIQESADDPAIRVLTPLASKRHIDADAELWEALQCFRGQSVDKALAELRDRLGVIFEPPTLLRLVDLGVLVEA
jgi:hypothetical protein